MGCGASSSTRATQPWIGKDDSTKSLPVVEEAVDRSQNSGCDAEVIPDYWYNKRTGDKEPFYDMYYVQDSEHQKFDDLMNASYVSKCTQDRPCPKKIHSRTPGGCPCVQPGGDPGLPTGFRVQRVIRVEASGMWNRYQEKLEKIKKKRGGKAPEQLSLLTEPVTVKHKHLFAPLDAGLNEVYAFHGTFVRYALSIAKDDFNINLAGSSRGTLYGRGAYLGDSITKADEYAKDEPDGYYSDVFAVLFCRVCMGKLYNTSDDPEAASRIKSGEFDSTNGQRLFRELVIYDSDQLYPEYVILYKRIYKDTSEDDIASTRKNRFFMEVPLHWGNTAKSLKERFCQQYSNTQNTNEFFQCLVNDSLRDDLHALTSSSRVENADLWKRYVDFKFGLRKQLGGPDGKHADPSSALGSVRKQMKDLTKWPCKFFQKGNCRFGEKCRFAHNQYALQLSNYSLSAGRRLPADELDDQLNEHFLWYPCSKRGANALSKGHFRKEGGTVFFTSLGDALASISSEDKVKYAMLCRVICGAPGSDCIISSTSGLSEEAMRFQVAISKPAQVYPEFILELFSETNEDGRKESDMSGLLSEGVDKTPDVCGEVKDEPLLECSQPDLSPEESKSGLLSRKAVEDSKPSLDDGLNDDLPLPGLSDRSLTPGSAADPVRRPEG